MNFLDRLLRTNDRRLAFLGREADGVLRRVDAWRAETDSDLLARWTAARADLATGGGWPPVHAAHPWWAFWRTAVGAQKAAWAAGVRADLLAVASLASERVLGLTPFRVQIMGALALLDGRLAEMRTGEGKTLTALVAALVHAADGGGVHIVTVNDYLAQRDAAQAARLAAFVGQTAVAIEPADGSDGDRTRKKALYQSDLVYVTATELGFDYLRDNMARTLDRVVLRGTHFAIVDEADSVLVDEARTPLIISGPADDGVELYAAADAVARQLTRQATEEGVGDYWANEKEKTVVLSETGLERAEELLTAAGLVPDGAGLWDTDGMVVLAHLNAALRAHSVFARDIDYIVRRNAQSQQDEVLIVDERTGRVLPGRRWSEGLHQALEFKEGAAVQPETQTVASITLQNLFRLYQGLAGMTGTAATEAEEFATTYGLEVVVVPTHRPMVRADKTDLVFVSHGAKVARLVDDIARVHATGQPILVGTGSIERNEELARLLTDRGIPHQVLNAKQHAQEAHVIAMAGRLGAVTIATNMAGRGTDIVLGGSFEGVLDAFATDNGRAPTADEERALRDAWASEHQQVVDLGGLYVMGAERHESRRVDNQLRGRSGRQGDPGTSQFYVSFDDPLVRLFAPDWAKATLLGLGMPEDQPVEMPMVARQIERAQRSVEAFHYDARKSLLMYDGVANEQRATYYAWRAHVLHLTDAQMISYVGDVLAEAARMERPSHPDSAPDTAPNTAPNTAALPNGGSDRDRAEGPFDTARWAVEGVPAELQARVAPLDLPRAWAWMGWRAWRRDAEIPLPMDVVAVDAGVRPMGLAVTARAPVVAETDATAEAVVDPIAGGLSAFVRAVVAQGQDATGDRLITAADPAWGHLGAALMRSWWAALVRARTTASVATVGAADEAEGRASLAEAARAALLDAYDARWRAHLNTLEQVRQGIHLRGYAQVDPRFAYRREAFELFADSLAHARRDAARHIMRRTAVGAGAGRPGDGWWIPARVRRRGDLLSWWMARNGWTVGPVGRRVGADWNTAAAVALADGTGAATASRNALCACGSGRKVRACHGALGAGGAAAPSTAVPTPHGVGRSASSADVPASAPAPTSGRRWARPSTGGTGASEAAPTNTAAAGGAAVMARADADGVPAAPTPASTRTSSFRRHV